MNALIIANGEVPSKKKIKDLLKNTDVIICADGGANIAKKLNIKPDLIIGDFDSVSQSSLRYFKDVKKIVIKDQNSTDLEKAINYCIKNKIFNVEVIGASGMRTDHTIGNLGCFKKFGKYVNLRLIDTNGEMFKINKFTKFKTKKGEIISLIPLNRCSGITTKNLKYELKNDFLELGVKEGTHNIAISEYVEISVKKGDLLVYRVFRY